MSAVRLARAFTGRSAILKFDGCYHGHADGFLVRAGSGIATLGLPDSPGVPQALASLTLVSPFNDAARVREMARIHASSLAAIIVEPVVGNAGFIAPDSAFLPELRAIADETGALLIFDEVMTGFRIAPGGARERFGVVPDLTTLGKVMGAGLATLRALTPALHDRMAARTARLVSGFGESAARAGLPFTADHAGSMWGYFFRSEPVRDFTQARASDTALFRRFYHAALARGVFMAPSPFEAAFVSAAHGDAEIDATLDRLDDALRAAVAS